MKSLEIINNQFNVVCMLNGNSHNSIDLATHSRVDKNVMHYDMSIASNALYKEWKEYQY